MSVITKGEISALEKYMIQGIKDCQTEHIKFTNTSFRCETIEDADGNIFTRLPERKKGKWMRQQGDYDWADICSECGESYIGKNYNMSSKPPVNFCPNCGADCRGGQDE